VSRSWWPWRRRSDKSEQPKSPGDRGRDKRHDETRRIVRHIKKEALHEEQAPEVEERLPGPPKGPTITDYDNIIHVNFHQASRLLEKTFVKKDPITGRRKRIAQRFDRSDVFYTKDGRLIDDNNMS
jgi:hypothetical protein